jgi:serine/threonine protein kinase
LKTIDGIVYSNEEKITADYRAPEHLYGHFLYIDKSDIWSLGIIFYSITNRKVFFKYIEDYVYYNEEEIDWVATLIRHIEKLRSHNKWPPSPISIINRMLSFKKEERPSFKEIRDDVFFSGDGSFGIFPVLKNYFSPSAQTQQIINNQKTDVFIDPEIFSCQEFDAWLIQDFEISINCPIKIIADKLFIRCYEFFDFYEYQSIDSNLYHWYQCCYSLVFRTFYQIDKINFLSKDIIILEQYILNFIRGRIT